MPKLSTHPAAVESRLRRRAQRLGYRLTKNRRPYRPYVDAEWFIIEMQRNIVVCKANALDEVERWLTGCD